MKQNIGSRHRLSSTSIHIMALDGTINVNSLFAFAAFVGFAFNPDNSLTSAACAASPASAKHLVELHIYSFSAFLFSSLIASALKLAIRAADTGGDGGPVLADMQSGGRVNLRVLRAGILASAAGSVFGCAFLTAALVDLVQIKLGNLRCWGWHAAVAVASLLILAPSALLIYVCLLIYAFIN